MKNKWLEFFSTPLETEQIKITTLDIGKLQKECCWDSTISFDEYKKLESHNGVNFIPSKPTLVSFATFGDYKSLETKRLINYLSMKEVSPYNYNFDEVYRLYNIASCLISFIRFSKPKAKGVFSRIIEFHRHLSTR